MSAALSTTETNTINTIDTTDANNTTKAPEVLDNNAKSHNVLKDIYGELIKLPNIITKSPELFRTGTYRQELSEWKLRFFHKLNSKYYAYNVSAKVVESSNMYEICCKTENDKYNNSITQHISLDDLSKSLAQMCRDMLCINNISMSSRSPKNSYAKIACASTINNIAKEHMYTLFPEGFSSSSSYNITSTNFSERYDKYLQQWKSGVYIGLTEHISYGSSQDFSEFTVNARDGDKSINIIRTLNANDVHGSQEILEAITSAINVVVQYVTV